MVQYSDIQCDLKSVQSMIYKCTDCELRQTCNQAVPGYGSNSANIVLVGEAPGETEDKGGQPFIGAAGEILTEAIESVGLYREDLYITNSVHCRPVKNAKPSTAIIDNCIEHTRQELLCIQPKYVVLLGSTATYAFLGLKSPMTKIVDLTKTIQITNHRDNILCYFIVYVMYHPAAILYNRSLYNKFFASWSTFKEIIEK